jgi:hypothetical protein
MKKTISLLILALCTYQIYAQTASFELLIPDNIVSNSLYRSIECIDETEAYPNLGNLNYPAKIEKVIEKSSLQSQLESLMEHITDETAQDRTLLLHIRELYFSEYEDKQTLCHIRMNLYEDTESGYMFIESIDEKLVSTAPKIMAEASYIIVSFIADNLLSEPKIGTPYTREEVENIATIEKADTPLYSVSVYEDGIYPSFISFAEQQPDRYEIQHKLKDGILKEVKIYNTGNNKWEKVKPQEVYAVVIDGQAYISKGKNFYLAYKKSNNIMFVAEESAGYNFSPSGTVGISAGSRHSGFGGGFGVVIGRKPKEKVTYMIDHLNGDFIFVGK